MDKVPYVSSQIEMSEEMSTLDMHVKNVLAIKPFLARIIKGTVSEVADYSPDEIESMIEGEPEVDTVPVDPGLTNHPKIAGTLNEDNVPFEGEIRYDILTNILIPGSKERVKILINIEGQRNYFPGYDLVTRGVYYGARRISAQKGVEFTGSDYNNIKKVYSIWICFDANKSDRNTITEYHMSKRNVYGETEGKERYDLISIVFVRIGGPFEDYKDNNLQQFLMCLFSETLTYEEKRDKLTKDYGILMSEEGSREVREMCDYGIGLAEKYHEQGRTEGRAEGKVEGRTLERMNSIERLREFGLSNEQLLSIGYTEKELEMSKQ